MPSFDLAHAFTTEIIEPTWIIRDYLPAGTIVLVAGDAGVGKSVASLTEALHVAIGRPFCGFATRQCRVLYFDQENSHADLLGYLQQLWIGVGQPLLETVAPWLRIEHFALGFPGWEQRVHAIITEWKPELVYIDTANAAFAIPEENDNAAAHMACQKLRRIIAQANPQPTFKLLKHAKYESAGGDRHGGTRRTIRGAKAWLGAVDQTAYHIRTPGRPRKDGLHQTVLVPDKTRAFGLRRNIRFTPTYTDAVPKGLILQGEIFTPTKDMMIVGEE